jgi:hypothetical protein
VFIINFFLKKKKKKKCKWSKISETTRYQDQTEIQAKEGRSPDA